MRTLAIIALACWLIASFVFMDWKRNIAYPERSFAVRFTTALSALTFVALAVWVIVHG